MDTTRTPCSDSEISVAMQVFPEPLPPATPTITGATTLAAGGAGHAASDAVSSRERRRVFTEAPPVGYAESGAMTTREGRGGEDGGVAPQAGAAALATPPHAGVGGRSASTAPKWTRGGE